MDSDPLQTYSMNLSTRKITLCPYGDNDRQDYTYRKMVRIGSRLYLGTMEHGVVVFDISTGKFRDNWIDLGCNVISSLSGDGKDILYVGKTEMEYILYLSRKIRL